MSLISRRGLLVSAAVATAASVVGHGTRAAAESPAQLSSNGVSSRRPSVPGVRINLKDYCSGDGQTNDAAGFHRAIDELSRRGGGTLTVPAGSFRIEPRGWITVDSNIAVVGEGPQSRIVLTAPSSGAYTVGFRVTGSNVAFDDLVLERGNDVYGSFFRVTGSDVWLQGLTLRGAMSSWDNDFNGVYLSGAGAYVSRFTMSNCILEDLNYGVYQNEDDSSTVTDVVIDNITGRRNVADDLEFCAPNGTIDGVLVQNSSFSDSRSPWIGAGFAIGIANAKNVTISGCSFDGYAMNPIHLERYTQHVRIADNRFVRASTKSTGFAAAVIVLSGSHDIAISGNEFDLSKQANAAHAIYVGPGGSGLDPYAVTVSGNAARLGGASFYVNYGSGWDSVNSTSLLG